MLHCVTLDHFIERTVFHPTETGMLAATNSGSSQTVSDSLRGSAPPPQHINLHPPPPHHRRPLIYRLTNERTCEETGSPLAISELSKKPTQPFASPYNKLSGLCTAEYQKLVHTFSRVGFVVEFV